MANILVVDDESSMRRLVRTTLETRGHAVRLAANGQAGVENVLDLLRDGLGSAMVGLGRPSVGELSRDDLVIPPGFERQLGQTAVDSALQPVKPSRRRREA